MNALQIADSLKNLSDQQLMSMRGRVPDYLLTADLARRQQMRQAGQASQALAQNTNPKTVSDDLWNSIMGPPTTQPAMMGPPMQGQLPPGPAPQPQMMGQMQPQPMSMGGMVNRMANGGMVRYAEGGAIDRIRGLLESMQQPRSLGDYANDARQLVGPDQMGPIMAQMQAQQPAPVVGKPSPWQALMRMGAAMMASRNPTAVGGIGEGLTQALNGYSQDRAAYQADQIRQQEQKQRSLAQQAQLAAAMNDRGMGIARLGAQVRGDDMSRSNTNLGLLGNAALSDSAADRAIQLETMREAAMKPLRDSQVAENQAQAEARAIQAQVFQSYLKKAGGDPAKAQIMMARDQAMAQFIERPQRLSPLESLQMQVIAEGKAAGESADDILGRLARLKSRSDLTEERMNERATRLYKTLLDSNPMAKMDPKIQEALWNQAVQMVAVGDFKQAKQEPVKPAKLGIKLGADGSIVMPNAKQQQQPVTGPFRVNLDQVINPR